MREFLKGLLEGLTESGHNDASGLCSYSGFVREAAVQALVSRPQRGTLPILLERLNDWVPQVRLVAEPAVRALMCTEFLPDWIDSIEGVVALQRARRADHTEMLHAIALYLSHPEHLQQIIESTKNAGLGVRRFVFDVRWLAAGSDQERFQLLRTAVTCDDVVLAIRALSRVADLSSSTQRRALYGTACVSPFGGLRCVGISWMVSHPDGATETLVRAMCLDVSSHVRWWCLRWLRSNGGTEREVAKAVAVAGDVLSPVRKRSTAMQFLVEADVGFALSTSEPWLTSASARLRRDALMVRLATGSHDEKTRWMQQAYADPSPTVRRLILVKAYRGIWVPSVDDLAESARGETTAETIRAFQTMRSLYSTWDGLQFLLTMLPLAAKSGAILPLVDALEAWSLENRNCSQGPNATQTTLLAALWSTHRTQLDASLRQTMDFHLKTFGIE